MCPLLYSDKSITTAPLLALLASLSLGYDPFFFSGKLSLYTYQRLNGRFGSVFLICAVGVYV